MGSVMTLFIVASDEATFEEVKLSEIKYMLVLSFVTSGFIFYPFFSLLVLSRNTSTPKTSDQPDISNDWREIAKSSLKLSAISFVLMLATTYMYQDEFNFAFALKYGFGGGILAALFSRIFVNYFIKDDSKQKNSSIEQAQHPTQKFRPNWIVVTISTTFTLLYLSFVVFLEIRDYYPEILNELANGFLLFSIAVGIAIGRWVRIRNRKIKEDNRYYHP